MFYSTQILAKKGPLGTIWIAAHLDRRLKRHQVFEANIAISVGALAVYPSGRMLCLSLLCWLKRNDLHTSLWSMGWYV